MSCGARLQWIIPGSRTNVEVTPVAGGKVSISIQQARKENPPEMLSLKDHTPSASNFVYNAGYCAHRKRHSRVAFDPCTETAVMTITTVAGSRALSEHPVLAGDFQ